MKKELLLLIFSLCIITTVQSQNILSEDNIWAFKDRSLSNPSTDYDYKLLGDTLIGAFNFKKVYRRYHWEVDWKFINYFIGKDTLGKIWYRHGSDLEDNFLYDFNVNLGDTVLNTPCVKYVSNIDSVMLSNGEVRRRLEISGGNYSGEYWIDGIGSTKGLLFHFGTCYTDHDKELKCFSINNIVQYNLTGGSCNLTNTKYFKAHSISLFPNPANHLMNIKNIPNRVNVFELIDFQGRVVKSGKVLQSEMQITLAEIEQGLYVLKLLDNKSVIAIEKFLKLSSTQ